MYVEIKQVAILWINFYYNIICTQAKDKATNVEMEEWIGDCYKQEVERYVVHVHVHASHLYCIGTSDINLLYGYLYIAHIII